MCTVFWELFFETHKGEGYSFQKRVFDIHRDGYGLCLLCRNLAELELQENEIDVRSGEWLTSFPETYTSLVSLNFATVRSEVNYVDVVALERLVARCPSLKKLKLNKEISLDQLQRLLLRAGPNLVELGTGSYSQSLSWGQLSELQTTLAKCKDLRSLSVVWEVAPMFVRTLYPVCLHLTTLNLSDVHLPTPDFTKLISHCPKLQRLLVSPFTNSLSPCMSVSMSVSLCLSYLFSLKLFPSATVVLLAHLLFVSILHMDVHACFLSSASPL
jgi:transport inhibitor response 1